MELKTGPGAPAQTLCGHCKHQTFLGDGEYFQGVWEFYVLACGVGLRPVIVEPAHPDGLLGEDGDPKIVVECSDYQRSV